MLVFFCMHACFFFTSVLIEKILRTNANIGKIYVMIKAKDTEAALKRLHNEVRCLLVLQSMVCVRAPYKILVPHFDDHSFLHTMCR